MKSTVKAYKRDKGTAISIFRIFLEFLKKEYTFEPDVQFPKIDTSNTFERQMYLAKELQMGEKTIEGLANELWISSRTIDDDLARLRGNKDPLQVCGKKFIVNETSARNQRMNFASTVHPLFLTFNITQVIATLRGLKYMCDDPGMKQYALLSASAIWQQLSEYAKQRIIYVSQKNHA